LIPAGDYLAPDYPAKLNDLDWSLIFSDCRNGVAFFQFFLARIKAELSPNVVIIDSRTGFNEIGGLCTQQLADETVFLSSMAKESIKMTRHLVKIIRESPIAKTLNRVVETKIVVSRVPKPAHIEELKERCCKEFEIEDTKLFFLFSCEGLEREEFVAMLDTSREESLVSNYIQLFRGLDVEIAEESIREEIERTERGLLSYSAEEGEAKGEARIREMVALFPHPEVYRRAMRFFSLNRRPEEASLFALRLLDFLQDDREAVLQVARFILRRDIQLSYGHAQGPAQRLLEKTNPKRLLSIAERAYATGQLTIPQTVRLADMLEDVHEYAKSFEIAMECLKEKKIDDPDLGMNTTGIAARTALRIGKKEEAAQLVANIPLSLLRGSLATLAIQLRIDKGEKKEAFEIAKTILARELQPQVIEIAAVLSKELGQWRDLEELVRTHPDLAKRSVNPESLMVLERFGFDVRESWDRSAFARRARLRP